MHWCHEETLALLSLIPFATYYIAWLRVWWHKKFPKKCVHHKDHDHK